MSSTSASPLWTITFGTVSISAASGIFTGAYSIFRNKPDASLLTSAAAANSGLTSFLFFTSREYAVSPILAQYAPGEQYARRRRELGLKPISTDEATTASTNSEAVSWSDLRWNKILDSGLSGVLTGGVLRGIRSGPPAAIPGAITVGAACTALQYGFNELSILRLRYVSSLQHLPESRPGRSPEQALNEVSEPVFQSLMKLFGVIPVSDEEYLAKLRRTREIYLRRVAELEMQVEEEKILKEIVKSRDS